MEEGSASIRKASFSYKKKPAEAKKTWLVWKEYILLKISIET